MLSFVYYSLTVYQFTMFTTDKRVEFTTTDNRVDLNSQFIGHFRRILEQDPNAILWEDKGSYIVEMEPLIASNFLKKQMPVLLTVKGAIFSKALWAPSSIWEKPKPKSLFQKALGLLRVKLW